MNEILKNTSISAFMQKNNLSKRDVFPFLAEFKIYLSNPQKYELKWTGMVELVRTEVQLNPGLFFLEESYFHKSITIDDIDYNVNSRKEEILKTILKSKKGIYLCGSNGIGKTFMSVAVANLYYQRYQIKTLFVFWPDFIEKTKRFSDNNIYYINKVKFAKRLIIDDLGQESISPWTRDDILNAIIAYRLEKGLYTMITSNYYQKELVDIYTLKQTESKKARAIVNKISALSPENQIAGRDLRLHEIKKN